MQTPKTGSSGTLSHNLSEIHNIASNTMIHILEINNLAAVLIKNGRYDEAYLTIQKAMEKEERSL